MPKHHNKDDGGKHPPKHHSSGSPGSSGSSGSCGSSGSSGSSGSCGSCGSHGSRGSSGCRSGNKRSSKKHCKPSLDKVLFELIESIAKEEKALARLIRSEADKIQAFLGKNHDFPTKPCNDDILDLNHSVRQMLETIVMKEWLLLKKLENTLVVIKRQDCKNKNQKNCKD